MMVEAPGDLQSVAVPDLLRHGEALGDDGPGLVAVHRAPVDVAHHVGLPSGKHHPAPLGQMGGHHAQGLQVVRPPLHHLGVVDPGELGVDRLW